MARRDGGQAAAHYGIHVIGEGQEASVESATVERVIIAGAVGEAGLVVIEEGVDGHVLHPFIHIDAALHIGDVISSLVAVGRVQDCDEVNEVGPIVGEEIVLFEIGVGVSGDNVVGALPSEVSNTVEGSVAEDGVADSAVGIAERIMREGALDEVVVVLLIGRVAAEGVVVRQTGQTHEVGAVDPHLHDAGFSHGDFQAAEHGAAQYLAIGVLGIEVDAGEVFPGPVAGDIDMVIVRVGLAAAMAAIADTGIVTDLSGGAAGDDAVGGDPGGVHLSVAVGVGALPADGVDFRPLHFGHDDAIEGLAAGVSAGIHLIEEVCGAQGVGGRQEVGICAEVALEVAHLEIELDDGPGRLGR